MDQSKRTGNNILCGFTIPSSCPICDILQVLFHTTLFHLSAQNRAALCFSTS
jgi:hypothetical protein